MEVTYRFDIVPSTEQITTLYRIAGLPRPIDDHQRIQEMYANSNLIVTAWHNDALAGVARCITDWRWSCYLADLAVDPTLQKSGIGKKLIDLVHDKLGEEVIVLLLSVPQAMEYYPKVGFSPVTNGFIIQRTK